MTRWVVAVAAAIAVAGLSAEAVQAGKVEVKGVHLCCGQCVKGVGKALAGVADAKCDQKGKTVTFTTKDAKGTEAGLKALVDAGFFGSATDDGKEIKLQTTAPKAGEKADEVTVKGVHVCCGQCQTAISALFKDAKITYAGTGALRDLKLSGKGLVKSEVLQILQKAGFTGKVE